MLDSRDTIQALINGDASNARWMLTRFVVRRAVVYESECSEEFEEELEADIKRISDQISVLRFLRKYPIFRKALASKPDPTAYASSLTHLSKDLSRDVLSRVNTHAKAQKMLEIDQEQLVTVCQILQIKDGGKS